MPKSVRTKKQAQFEKRALKKLQSTGLYSGKVDFRKAPTKYQKALIRKFSDVVTGKAAVVKPANPKAYPQFKQRAGRVIVPRRKGERITVTKTGEIEGKRRVGRRVVKSKFRHVPKGERVPRSKAGVQYAIPFNSGGGEIRWQRFPDYDTLAKFMEGYNYKDWPDYVVEEKIGADENEDADEKLDAKLERRLSRKKRR
jgi:hypothetical protein